MEISVTGTDLARPEVKKKKSVTQMHTKFRFLVESFFVFIANTVLESIKTPRSVSFQHATHSGTMESHCCLNSFVNSSYIDSVEISSHLPVKMKPFLCLLIQMDFHADLYTMSSPTRHLNTIRRTQTKIFVNFK